jgi:hypothetical protein
MLQQTERVVVDASFRGATAPSLFLKIKSGQLPRLYNNPPQPQPHARGPLFIFLILFFFPLHLLVLLVRS